MKLDQAQAIAQDLVTQLAPFCDRIQVAGSVRRGKSEPGDIEIVCTPLIFTNHDMFGGPTDSKDYLETFPFGNLGKVIKKGARYKQIELNQGINLDLFIVRPPAQWGVIYLIRTGPAQFNSWLVTSEDYGGGMRTGCRMGEGNIFKDCQKVYDERLKKWIYIGGTQVFTPEEIDVFNFLEMPWIEPKDRRPHWHKWGSSKTG